jgi:hypothetical protein
VWGHNGRGHKINRGYLLLHKLSFYVYKCVCQKIPQGAIRGTEMTQEPIMKIKTLGTAKVRVGKIEPLKIIPEKINDYLITDEEIKEKYLTSKYRDGECLECGKKLSHKETCCCASCLEKFFLDYYEG